MKQKEAPRKAVIHPNPWEQLESLNLEIHLPLKDAPVFSIIICKREKPLIKKLPSDIHPNLKEKPIFDSAILPPKKIKSGIQQEIEISDLCFII